jgi:hypothetical protein
MKMTTEEAFVKVLQQHGIEHAFGIIGSAFMPISDLFTRAGITFWDVAHETNGGLICDGYTRSTGKIAMAIAQNGPGVTGFVTAIKTAYWNHTPMLLVTPQAANKTIGQGGFQEVEQMALFRDMVGYQEEVRDPTRVAEVLNRVICKAKRLSAPAQINIPRDFWTQVIDVPLPTAIDFERPAGGAKAIAEAARLLKAEGVAARFVVVGRHDDHNPTGITPERMAQWVGEGVLEYHGFSTAMGETLREADIACLPSYGEGMPRGLMEAAATGLPMVTTLAPGCREAVIPGKTGVLVPVRDARALADALRPLVLDPALRQRMGAAARQQAIAEFSAEDFIARSLAAYAAVLPMPAGKGSLSQTLLPDHLSNLTSTIRPTV